ncbi:MAG: hypothetical protein Q9227_005127 [Pyrenula ochraceoflavens]
MVDRPNEESYRRASPRYTKSRFPDLYRSRSRSRERQQLRRTQYSDRRRRSLSPPRKRRRSDSPKRSRNSHEKDTRSRKQSPSRSPSSYLYSHSHQRRSRSRSPLRRSKAPLPSQNDAFKNEGAVIRPEPLPEKQKPNFQTTGRLATESNTITSVDGQAIVLKYHEPTEARKPSAKDAWRIYVFKGSEVVDTVELGARSCWLFGRERAVVDYAVEHPSCSKQHAVLQFRYLEKRNEFGDRHGKVRPYVIDLESGNGTFVNGDAVPAGRYMELRDKDVLKFGHSSREYVLMLPPPA